MALRLAPYNNAMRLGQGFNSYSQQICVDDAVVIDPDRAENVVTNDGTTMRIMAQIAARPSVWTRQKEVAVDDRAGAVLLEKEAAAEEQALTDDVDAVGEEPSEGQEAEAETLADEAATPVALEEKEHADAEAEVNEKFNESAEELPEESGEVLATALELTDKSDSDSFEKIESSEAEEAREANPAEKGESGVAEDEESAAASKNSAEKPTAAPSQVHHPAKGIPAQSAVRPRSSSVDGTHGPTSASARKARSRSQVAEVPLRQAKTGAKTQNRNRLQVALARSKAEEAARKREAEDVERAAREKEEKERIAELAAYRKEIEKEARDELRARRVEDRKEQQKIRKERRIYEAQRREDNRKAIANAADIKSLNLQDLDKIKAQNQFADRFVGMAENQEDVAFAPRGPSQTVVYTSRFVDRLSDVTDDMSVSGALSIKAAKIGGSGRGSFVDSDKFKESDLNFYISVKVINQTLNFKDALVYNPLRSVDAANFQEVYGDSFISGFLEGGEFSALVSMKILNKAKLTDIKAEAKVAFTTGAIDVNAEANVGVARSNIETNTETTIQVSWCGGGHIKPMEQQWNTKSLMAAAARFPDLVADCPQRTYAILTKYDSLRSFVARKPAAYTPLQYENAQIYTNALLDSFMSYKSLYKRLGEQIFNVQGKTLEITSWEKKDAAASAADGTTAVVASSAGYTASKVAASHQAALQKDPDTGHYPHVEDLSHFEASVVGLNDARKAIRRQMLRIVNEVDLIEKDPKTATDDGREEPFQQPVTFETRLPDVVIPENLQPKNDPLTGKIIMAKSQSEDELNEQLRLEEEAARAPALYAAEDDLSMEEKSAFDKLKTDRPGVGRHLRVSSAVGNTEKGVPFSNLEFLQGDWGVDSVRLEIAFGAVACVEVTYDNGLLLRKGKRGSGKIEELNSFRLGERVANGSIEYGVPLGSQDGPRVLAVRLYTNHGRRLLGQATENELGAPGRITKDNVEYEQVKSVFVDSPLSKGTFKGFFGRCNESIGPSSGILRLGLIWGDASKPFSTPNASAFGATAQEYDYGGQPDEPKTQVTFAQGGLVEPLLWSEFTPDFSNYRTVKFQPPYSQVPRTLSGLAKVDGETGPEAIRVAMNHQNITPNGFESFARTFGGARSWAPKMSWLTIPENDIHFETGLFESYNVSRSADMQTITSRVSFAKKFVGAPTVVTWFSELNFGGGWHSLTSKAQNITQDSFELIIGTWDNRNFDGVRVGWLAFNDTRCVSHAKAGRIRVTRAERKSDATVTFEGQEFSKTPAVFFAVAEIDAGDEYNLRLEGEVASATRTGFTYSCGTWADANDHNMDHSDWVWIAIE